MNQQATKYCKFCGKVIADDAAFCANCGRQVEKNSASQAPQVIVNKTNTNVDQPEAVIPEEPKNKWVAFLLCLFVGVFGAHQFYEGDIAMGLLYLFTFGLLGVGWIVDCISILLNPNPYYVRKTYCQKEEEYDEHYEVNLPEDVIAGKPKDKWVSLILCLFVGLLGVHKFYEGKVKMGFLYLFTFGLLGIGWIVDCISLLYKQNPYYV